MDVFRQLLSSDFMPHGSCYLWNTGLIYLHVLSDSLITLSYYAIPFTLVYFVRKRRDLPFHWMFLCFGVFIIACGTTHLMEIWTIWHSNYWLSGVVKAITAIVSVPTAILLVQLVPKALLIPSPEALRKTEQRFRLIIEGVRDYAIFMLDSEGNVMTWNAGAERIKGYKTDEIVGKHFSIFYPPEDRETGKAARSLKTATEEGRYEEEGFRMRKDGTRFWADVVITALRDEKGQIYAFAKITRDITERKKNIEEIKKLNESLEKRALELEAANKDLESFSYSVSHDLRSPLRAIDGFSRMLLQKHSSQLDSEGERLLGVVRTNTQRMGELIDALLSFSRLGRQEIRVSEINVDQLFEEVYQEQRALNPERTVEFRKPVLPPAQGDRNLLRQVFENLLSNAFKFTAGQNPAVIEVNTDSRNGMNLYSIRDNGVGFDMQYGKKLFKVFQRLHSPQEYEGTGVGLALVHRIITRHGGSVWAEGKTNEGAVFYFTLPKAGAKSQ